MLLHSTILPSESFPLHGTSLHKPSHGLETFEVDLYSKTWLPLRAATTPKRLPAFKCRACTGVEPNGAEYGSSHQIWRHTLSGIRRRDETVCPCLFLEGEVIKSNMTFT